MRKIIILIIVIYASWILYNNYIENNEREITNKKIKEMYIKKEIKILKIIVDEYNKRIKYVTDKKVYEIIVNKRIIEKIEKEYEKIEIKYRKEPEIIIKIIKLIIYIYITIEVLKIIFPLKKEKEEIRDNKINEEESFNIIKSEEIEETFEDIIGNKKIKEEMKQCIDYIKNKEKYERVGYKIPKGIIINGPPGTGKTMIAKAMAKEAGIKYIYTTGSSFIEKYAGTGQKRVKEIFRYARKNSPCIIFIDEIDGIGNKRNEEGEVSMEYISTINQLLTEMDGIEENKDIIVIGATNMIEIIDKSITRSGRIDKIINVREPDIEEREELFKLYMKKIKKREKIGEEKIKYYAKITIGLTGADIKNIINTGLGISLKKEKEGVSDKEILEAIEEIMIGERNIEKKINEEEKKMIAVHESGHAIMMHVLKNTKKPLQISILPRGNTALGYTTEEYQEKQIHKRNDLEDEICVLLAGRLSEEIIYGKNVSTGAVEDIERATKIAYDYVTIYGYDEEVNMINYNIIEGMSEYMKKIIDMKVQIIINKNRIRVLNILKKHKNVLIELSKKLKEKEILHKKDIKKILKDNIKNIY